ncbi:hypothetical protein AVEN_83458-1 [Araneus ventricosus]|uniref:Retrovirus-related Pol polyprotein from transposon TNT 1-94-like beta-barrel domain-containing protein n=1 Tax=Araneus ventricosus TaxID=182803 RepID=A0A4Y2JQV8_ARAVE|nr:hypothetical protein AVEN_83458-1 [Araneus ventricosus]
MAKSEGFEFSSIETVTRKRPAEFLIDSSATTHICNQKVWFSNFKPIYPTEVLVGERVCSNEAVGVEDVKFIVLEIKVETNLKKLIIST